MNLLERRFLVVALPSLQAAEDLGRKIFRWRNIPWLDQILNNSVLSNYHCCTSLGPKEFHSRVLKSYFVTLICGARLLWSYLPVPGHCCKRQRRGIGSGNCV